MSTTAPITDQSQGQSRYVQLPNGSYMEWPQGVSAEEFKAKAAQVGGAPPDDRNSIQRGFDKLTTVTPEQEQGHSWLTNKAQELGAGVIQGVGSPFVHPLQTLTGVGHTIAHPLDTALELGESAINHPFQTSGNLLAAAELAGGVTAAGSGLVDLLPSATRAGEAFNSLKSNLADQPVQLTRSQPILQAMKNSADNGGGTLPTPLRQLINRSGQGNPRSVPLLRAMQDELNGTGTAAPSKPILYPQARSFQEGFGKLSREDSGKLSGSMGGQFKQLQPALYGDIRDAAEQRGMGDVFDQAMSEYRHNAQLKNLVRNSGKVLVPAAAGAAGLGLAHRFFNTITDR